MLIMGRYFRLPLLPLHTVLFPGQPIPLHVSDPLYQRLVVRSFEESTNVGVVLIREGLEKEGLVIPYTVGTVARITFYQQSEIGLGQLVAVGQHRFRILDLVNFKPPLEALVSLWPWSPEPAPSQRLMDTVGEWLRRYVAALADVVPPVLEPEALPQDAAALGVLAAVILQVSLSEKQALLETPTAVALVRSPHMSRVII